MSIRDEGVPARNLIGNDLGFQKQAWASVSL